MVRLIVCALALLVALTHAHNSIPGSGFGIDPGYDYIIVGAGTAGCVLAGRLSANPNVNVLLIGAGHDTSGDPQTALPLLHPNANLPSDYSRQENFIKTIEGPGMARASLDAVWAQALGGASAINGGVFVRVADLDWDKVAAVTQDARWGRSRMGQVYTTYVEHFLDFAGGPTPAGHGTSGSTIVRAVPPDQFLALVMAAFQNATGTAWNLDLDLGNVNGTGIVTRPLGGDGTANVTATGNYQRQSTYSTYIAPYVATRRNLKVVDNALVTRVDGSNACAPATRGQPCFNQVTYVRQGVSTVVQVARGGEIVLSAGALQSPKILMQSGIGDCDYLATLDIECVYNNTGVGANFYDHFLLGQLYFSPLPSADWAQHVGSIVGTYYSLGRDDGVINMELAASEQPLALAPGVTGTLFVIEHEYTQPYSTGVLALQEADYNAPVNVSLGALSDPRDVAIIAQSYQIVRNAMDEVRATMEAAVGPAVVAALAAQGLTVLQETSLPRKPNIPVVGASAATLQAYVQGALGDDYHYVATTRMGVCGAPGVVVDASLRVCGVSNLRVVDNGVMPFAYSGHTTHTGAMTIAENAALILAAGQ